MLEDFCLVSCHTFAVIWLGTCGYRTEINVWRFDPFGIMTLCMPICYSPDSIRFHGFHAGAIYIRSRWDLEFVYALHVIFDLPIGHVQGLPLWFPAHK